MNVYEEPVRTRYTANSLGAYLLILFGYAAIVIAPLAIGFGLGQFWLTSNVLTGKADISYTGKMVVKMTTADGNEYAYISSNAMMEALEDSLTASGNPNTAAIYRRNDNGLPLNSFYPAVNLYRDDHDNDGITDTFNFEFTIPMDYRNQSVAKICVLPEFYYTFDNPTPKLKILMTGAPLICATNPTPSTPFEAARIQGDLVFHASTLPESSGYVRYDRIYRASLFDSFTASQMAAVAPVASAYALRNFTLAVDEKLNLFGDYSILRSSESNIDHAATLNTFNYEVTLKVQKQVIRYIPPWHENLKFGWVQYFCIAYVVYWVIDGFKSVLVKQAVINTIAIWESRQRVIN